MARVKPEAIVDHLSSEFRRALEDAVKEVTPQANFDSSTLFSAFRRGGSAAPGSMCLNRASRTAVRPSPPWLLGFVPDDLLRLNVSAWFNHELLLRQFGRQSGN